MEKNFSSFQLQSAASSWPSFEEIYGRDGAARAEASNSKSHSEAEKRRRDSINGQLQTLRKLTPKSEKMDKAALLANVIQHVKDLKVSAAEVRKAFTVPGNIDELLIRSVETNSSSGRISFIQVCICCEDRPELFAELGKTLQSLRLTTVQAEMATLGCRVQIILLLSTENGDLELNLKQTLREGLNRVVNSSQSESSYRVASKRQRFFSCQR